MKLTVTGTVFVDIKGYPVGSYVPAGRNVGRVEQFHGGVGRNIAEDVNNAGAETTFVGLVDEGGIGADVVSHLKSSGINTDYVLPAKDGMGTWLAIFDLTGEVSANISKRPVLAPILDIYEKHGDEILSRTDAMLLEIDIDEAAAEKVIDLSEKHDVPVYAVISNISIAAKRMDLIRRCRCFICNRQEAEVLFGLEPESMRLTIDDAIEKVKAHAVELGLKSIVVTMDKDGAVYYDAATGQSGHCPAEEVKVVDTTGAGDSFFAGVSLGLSQGKSLDQACSIGAKMAAVVIASENNVYLPVK